MIVGLPVAAGVIWLLLHAPVGRRIVSQATGERWSERSTPSFGGVGIFAAFVTAMLCAAAAGALPAGREFWATLGAVAIVFLAGLIDDLWSLPPLAKLAAQIGAAALVLANGLSVQVVHNQVLAAGLGVLWLVGITNAFNLLDNMDGLAGSLAFTAAIFFAIDALTLHPRPLLLVCSLSIAAACLGFLPFNFRPGRPAAVFMGDSGSQVLGFALGACGLVTSYRVAESTIATLLLPMIVLAIPILDTALVTVTRLLDGRPVYRGGRDHTSHRLALRGLSERRTVVLLVAIAAALGTTSLAYSGLGNTLLTTAGVLVTFALLVQFAGFLTDAEGPQVRDRERPLLLRAILLRPRRLVEVSVDFALTTAAFACAYFLIVSQGNPQQRFFFFVSLPVLLGCRVAAFILAGLYRSIWRFAGSRDLAAVVSAVTISELIAFGIIAVSFGVPQFPLRIFVVDAILATILLGASRFGERALFRLLGTLHERDNRRRTLVVGAGRAGRSLVRELREAVTEQVVGYVDDDARLRGRRMQGVMVLGGCMDIDSILQRTTPDRVLVTIPEAPRERLDVIVETCFRAGVECKFARREIDLDPYAAFDSARE